MTPAQLAAIRDDARRDGAAAHGALTPTAADVIRAAIKATRQQRSTA
jgi:hypothetical protein